MLDDNLNIKRLREIIGEAKFETPNQFKDFLKPQLLQHLALKAKRLIAIPKPDKGRTDLQIFDNLTNRETLLLIGLKTANTTPQFTTEDVAAFHETCKEVQALFGCLMTETEAHFYEFKYEIKKGLVLKTDVKEIPDIRPLNHIDAEFERVWTVQKVKDVLLAHRNLVIVVSLLLILMIASALAQQSICRNSGEVKGVVSSQGAKTYYLPTSPGYSSRQATTHFCSEGEAESAGYTKGN